MPFNPEIKQLKSVLTFKPDQEFPLYDPESGEIANKISASLLGSSTSGNYNWNSTTAYNFGQISVYGGKLWSSLVPGIGTNLGNIPTEGLFWTEESRAPGGLTLWQSGVYLEDEVYKWHNKRIYALINPTRPYNSTDINAEILANDWEEWSAIESDAMRFRLYWDASSNQFPNASNTTLSDTNIKKGFVYYANNNGNPAGVGINEGQFIMAMIDNPGNIAANWKSLS